MKRFNKKTIGWFLFAVVTFVLLGRYSISLGDDLGYMFADSALHKGDGDMITNLRDCITTQANHYFSTNGRFLVHTVTHFFLAVAGMTKYNIANAIMFGLLFLLTVKFIIPQRQQRGWYVYVLSLFLLLTCVPAPGAVMLSLVAFAVNYMWTAVAYLAFLLMLKKATTKTTTFKQSTGLYIWSCIGAIVVGSLQESYALPMSATLFIMAMFNLKKINSFTWTLIGGFFAGCGICVFAPGNWCHAAQGGGFTFDSIMRKSEALFEAVSVSAIALLALLLLIFAVVNRKKMKQIVAENAFFLIAIVVSLLLAVFTFTSERQLFCPSIFSIIVLGRIIMNWKQPKIFKAVSMTVMIGVLMSIFVGGYILRKNTYEIHSKVLEQLGGSSKVIFANATNANYNSDSKIVRLMADMYAPDPLANKKLHLLFDGYTKRGLSRIGWENRSSKNIVNFSPYPAYIIAAHYENYPELQPIAETSGCELKVISIDEKYKLARAVKDRTQKGYVYMPFATANSKTALPYEVFIYRGYRYIILPASAPESIYLKKVKL